MYADWLWAVILNPLLELHPPVFTLHAIYIKVLHFLSLN